MKNNYDKRNQVILKKKDADLAQYFSFFAGLGFAGLGAFLALTNPQFTSQSRDATLYENGALKQEIAIKPKKTSRNIGLSSMLLGFGLIGVSLKFGSRITFEDVIEVEETIQKVEKDVEKYEKIKGDKLDKEERQSLMYPLIELTMAHPWLIDAMKAPAVVIVGKSGSGKSRLAMAVGLLNAIFREGEITILDPDTSQNLRSGSWVAGKVYGSSEDTRQSCEEIIEGLRLSKLKSRNEDSKFLVTIIDELSKWDNYPLLEPHVESALVGGTQEARKRSQQYIYLVHDLQKGMFSLGNSNSEKTGIVSNLLSTACILALELQEDDGTLNLSEGFGKGRKAEILYWHKAGQILDGRTLPSKKRELPGWEGFNLPLKLDPSFLSQAFSKHIQILGLKLDLFNSRQKEERMSSAMNDPALKNLEKRMEEAEKELLTFEDS